MCSMTKSSFILPPNIRQLRDLMRYRTKLTYMLAGEKDRALNCLTISNLKLDDVFSGMFGNSSRSISQYILDHRGEQFDVTPFLDRRCTHSVEEVQAAVDGSVPREQATGLRKYAYSISTNLTSTGKMLKLIFYTFHSPMLTNWSCSAPSQTFHQPR